MVVFQLLESFRALFDKDWCQETSTDHIGYSGIAFSNTLPNSSLTILIVKMIGYSDTVGSILLTVTPVDISSGGTVSNMVFIVDRIWVFCTFVAIRIRSSLGDGEVDWLRCSLMMISFETYHFECILQWRFPSFPSLSLVVPGIMGFSCKFGYVFCSRGSAFKMTRIATFATKASNTFAERIFSDCLSTKAYRQGITLRLTNNWY